MSMRVDGVVDLQRVFGELSGAQGKAAIRKGQRAGAKIIAARLKILIPKKRGTAAGSVKIRALKRTRKGRIGVRIEVYAGSGKGKTPNYPYPFAVNYGTKNQPRGNRIRRRFGARPDTEANAKYAALGQRIAPRHFAERAFSEVSGQALSVAQKTMLDEIDRLTTAIAKR